MIPRLGGFRHGAEAEAADERVAIRDRRQRIDIPVRGPGNIKYVIGK
jgi:hypothetical protein